MAGKPANPAGCAVILRIAFWWCDPLRRLPREWRIAGYLWLAAWFARLAAWHALDEIG